MPKSDGTIRVQEIAGEALRYLVESWSNPKLPHLVDLSDHNGNGSCSCTDFVTRRQINIREGADLFTRDTSCRHLVAARKHFTIQTLTQVAAMVKEQEKAPRRPAPTCSPTAKTSPKPSPSQPDNRQPYSGYC